MRDEEKFRAYQKEYYLKNKEKITKQHDDYWKAYWQKVKATRPKKICPICNVEFSGRLNQTFCSKQCKETSRNKRRRQTLEYKAYQKVYQKEWDKKNPEKRKAIDKKFRSSDKRKEWKRRWWKQSPNAKLIRKRYYLTKGKECSKKWAINNPEKVKQSYNKYSKTNKGKLNQIYKTQNRRKKFKGNGRPKKELINLVDKRDTKCVYCDGKFIGGKNYPTAPTYDHLDAFKPHSEINTIKACHSCNSSKLDKPVLEWLKEKGFEPSPLVLDLLEKQREQDAKEN